MAGAAVLTMAMAELPPAVTADELDPATAAAAASPSSAALSPQPQPDGGQAESAQLQQPQHAEDRQSLEQEQQQVTAPSASSSPSPPPVSNIHLGAVDSAASFPFSPSSSSLSSPSLQQAQGADGPMHAAAAAAAAARSRYTRKPGGASLSVSHHGPVDPAMLRVPRVYVGNLAFSVGWQDLKDFFRNSIGSVGRVEIISFPSGRSKGCAIVEFDSIAEAARAINQLNNSEIHGRKIFIREDREGKGFGSAASRTAAGGGGGAAAAVTAALGVPAAGVSIGWPPAPSSPAGAAALQYGSPLGPLGGGGGLTGGSLYSTQMLQFNLYYHQYMHTLLQHQQRQQQEAAQQQTQQQTQPPLFVLDQYLQPSQQPSRPLMPPAPLTDFYSSRAFLPVFPFDSLLPANVAPPLSPLSATSPTSPPSAPGCQLLLSNLPFSVNWQQLKELCSHHGDVVWADVVMDRLTGKSRGVGLVRFASPEQATAALDDMRGMELEGRKIHVRRDEH